MKNFILKDSKTVVKDSKKYLSFPYLLNSKEDDSKLFLVYRSGNAHNPIISFLHFLVSYDKGGTWKELHKMKSSLPGQGYVWNCPVLCYLPDGSLNIFCDTKTQTKEVKSQFCIYRIKSKDDGKSFSERKFTGMRGMVPDKVINFKGKLFCANHKIINKDRNLKQMINWSKDKGKSWNNFNTLAYNKRYDLCEAAIVNNNNKYLLAYMRDNRNSAQPIHKYISYDGIKWRKKSIMKIHGHKVCALLDGENIVGVFRNTKDVTVSLFTYPIGREGDMEIFHVDKEKKKNTYNYGYSGIVKIGDNEYLISYYIKRKEKYPYIKNCVVKIG